MKKNFDLKLIGRIIKEERKIKNFAQIDIAKIFSINQSTISRIEIGENISLEMYELVLGFFGINLFGEEKITETLLIEIYTAIECNDASEVEKIYEHVLSFEKLSIDEFYLKLIIQGLYLVFSKNIVKLEAYIPYLTKMKFVFKKSILRYYHIIRGYYFYFHHEYEKADDECNLVLAYVYQGNINDNLFNYLFSINHIHLRNYGIAQEILEKAREHNQNSNKLIKLHTNRLLAYIYFFNSNCQECIELIKDNKPINKETGFESNFLLAASYLILKKYAEAIPYLEDIIATDLPSVKEKMHLYYAYLLICLKSSENSLFSYYYEKVKLAAFYQNNKLRALFESLVIFGLDLRNQAFYKNFNNLFKDTYLKQEHFIHIKLLYSVARNKIWSNRKYTFYKKLNDIMINKKVGCTYHDL